MTRLIISTTGTAVIFTLACLCWTSTADTQTTADTRTTLTKYENFSDWAKRHNRTYVSAKERQEREQNYAAYQQQVERNARAQPGAKYDMDDFADWSPAELRGLRGLDFSVRGNMTYRDPSHVFDGYLQLSSHNNIIDWVQRGAVTSPTSQGRCATCQDFSAVADLEGAWFLAGHPLVKLSEQELIDCGGGDGYGMKWVITHGVALNKDVPLANHSDPNITGCRQITNCTRAIEMAFTHITGVSCMTNHNETQILTLLQTGPVSVSIAAHNFAGYKSGIIDCDANGIDHAVTLVGYGEDHGTAYWKLKNSWGPAFGEAGYFRFKFGNLCLRGPCRAYVGKPPVYDVQTTDP